MVNKKDIIKLDITPEMIQEAKTMSKVQHGSFEFRLDEAIKKRNNKPSSGIEKWLAVYYKRIIFSYWVEMNIWEQYSGSGQMNYYYNCIIKLAELGVDVEAMEKRWLSKKEQWKREFKKEISKMDDED